MKLIDYFRLAHYGDHVLKLARQPRPSEEQEIEGLHWLHQPQRSILKGQLPLAKDRPNGRGDFGHELLSFMDAYSGYN